MSQEWGPVRKEGSRGAIKNEQEVESRVPSEGVLQKGLRGLVQSSKILFERVK